MKRSGSEFRFEFSHAYQYLKRRPIFVLDALLDALSDTATRILHNPDDLGIGIMC
jgi:hypothetical protein